MNEDKESANRDENGQGNEEGKEVGSEEVEEKQEEEGKEKEEKDKEKKMEEFQYNLLIIHSDKYMRRELVKLFKGEVSQHLQEKFGLISECRDMIPELWEFEGEIYTDTGRRKLLIRIAQNAEQYRKFWEDHTHHAVLLDLFLPESTCVFPSAETGMLLLSEIKKKDKKTQVIVFTDQMIFDWALEAVKRNAFYFVERPHICLEFVYALVARIIEMTEAFCVDHLTQLYNRRFFDEELKGTWKKFEKPDIKRPESERRYLSLIMIDADDFRKINSDYGYQGGDEALRILSGHIRSFRDTDLKCRYGGEEFIIIAPNMDHESALRRSEELRETIEREASKQLEHNLRGQEKVDDKRLTISVGVATFPNPNSVSNIDELIKAAENALKRAKENGKNRVYGYTKDGEKAPFNVIYPDKPES